MNESLKVKKAQKRIRKVHARKVRLLRAEGKASPEAVGQLDDQRNRLLEFVDLQSRP